MGDSNIYTQRRADGKIRLGYLKQCTSGWAFAEVLLDKGVRARPERSFDDLGGRVTAGPGHRGANDW